MCLCRHRHCGIGNSVGYFGKRISRTGRYNKSIKLYLGTQRLSLYYRVYYISIAQFPNAFYEFGCLTEAGICSVNVFAHYGKHFVAHIYYLFQHFQRLFMSAERAAKGISYHTVSSSVIISIIESAIIAPAEAGAILDGNASARVISTPYFFTATISNPPGADAKSIIKVDFGIF